MANVSNIEERKQRLTAASDAYKERLRGSMNDTVGGIERGVVTAAIVGGTLFVGYKFLQRLLANEETDVASDKIPGKEAKKNSGKGKKRKKHKKQLEPDDDSRIIKSGLQTVALFALSVLREKIVEYIENPENSESDE